jgi:L-alanine-DL-glutamate epimerase-like enolase superfamily enzyme
MVEQAVAQAHRGSVNINHAAFVNGRALPVGNTPGGSVEPGRGGGHDMPERAQREGRAMKIVKIEDLHCDAGWRVNSYVKITTDEGIVGWSEFMEGYGSLGLSSVIGRLGERLIGRDPRPVERISRELYSTTVQAPGGVNAQAIAAIENALIDIKAKALGVPVYELLGGPFRDRLLVYWSHCGSYRARHADRIKEWAGVEPVRSLDDIVRLGAEVKRKGFKGLKTNIIRFDRDKPYMYHPGTGHSPGWPELNVSKAIVDAAAAQLAAFREGAGPDMALFLDTNFNYKIDGYVKLARALEKFDLAWLEIDLFEPAGLALVRRSARTPIASCESLYGRRQFRPFFDQQAVDYAIIDVAWNGILESVKIAAMAEAYEVNVAPHNFNGHLGSLISAHFCAAVPNFKIMEIDIDDVTWKDDTVTAPPVIENGELLLPKGPGWGADVNEEFVRAHPPRR